MCTLTSLKYECMVETIPSKINKKEKKQDFRKVILKDHNGNMQKELPTNQCVF